MTRTTARESNEQRFYIDSDDMNGGLADFNLSR